MNKQFSIILTDDDRDDQTFLTTTIQEINKEFNILSTYDGQELMDVLSGLKKDVAPVFSRPDLIFLDLNMPRMDGYEVLKAIRENNELKSIPVFILTTSEFEYDKIKAIAYGANGFYSKPLIPADLKKIVLEIFSKVLKPASLKSRVS